MLYQGAARALRPRQGCPVFAAARVGIYGQGNYWGFDDVATVADLTGRVTKRSSKKSAVWRLAFGFTSPWIQASEASDDISSSHADLVDPTSSQFRLSCCQPVAP